MVEVTLYVTFPFTRADSDHNECVRITAISILAQGLSAIWSVRIAYYKWDKLKQTVRLSRNSCIISVLSLYESSFNVSSSAIASSNACHIQTCELSALITHRYRKGTTVRYYTTHWLSLSHQQSGMLLFCDLKLSLLLIVATTYQPNTNAIPYFTYEIDTPLF